MRYVRFVVRSLNCLFCFLLQLLLRLLPLLFSSSFCSFFLHTVSSSFIHFVSINHTFDSGVQNKPNRSARAYWPCVEHTRSLALSLWNTHIESWSVRRHHVRAISETERAALGEWAWERRKESARNEQQQKSNEKRRRRNNNSNSNGKQHTHIRAIYRCRFRLASMFQWRCFQFSISIVFSLLSGAEWIFVRRLYDGTQITNFLFLLKEHALARQKPIKKTKLLWNNWKFVLQKRENSKNSEQSKWIK